MTKPLLGLLLLGPVLPFQASAQTSMALETVRHSGLPFEVYAAVGFQSELDPWSDLPMTTDNAGWFSDWFWSDL